MSQDNPGIRFPPPLLWLAFFLAAFALRPLYPATIPYGREIGMVLGVLSVALVAWGIATMWRAHTTILPHAAATALVTHGPFRFTRNPLYLAMVVGYLSAAFWIGVVAAFVLLPIAFVVFHYLVIRREEAYLTRHFGDDYRDYRRRVRRWL